MLCSPLGVRGLQELELAMVCTPVSHLVDFKSGKVHKTGKSAPYAGAPSPSVKG